MANNRRAQGECFSCGTCGAPKAKPRSDTNLKTDFSHIMLQITCVLLINSLPADIIFDSFDSVVVQWNRETQTLRRAKSVLKNHLRKNHPPVTQYFSWRDFFVFHRVRFSWFW